MAIQEQDVMSKAAELGVAISKTVKSRKSYWTLSIDNNTMQCIGNKAAMEALNMLSVVMSTNCVGQTSPTIKIKNGVLENPNKTTQAMMLVCDDPSMGVADVVAQVANLGKATAAVVVSDTKKAMAYLQKEGRLLA